MPLAGQPAGEALSRQRTASAWAVAILGLPLLTWLLDGLSDRLGLHNVLLLYLLTAVEETALDAMHTVQRIKDAMMDYKHRIRAGHTSVEEARRLIAFDTIERRDLRLAA